MDLCVARIILKNSNPVFDGDNNSAKWISPKSEHCFSIGHSYVRSRAEELCSCISFNSIQQLLILSFRCGTRMVRIRHLHNRFDTICMELLRKTLTIGKCMSQSAHLLLLCPYVVLKEVWPLFFCFPSGALLIQAFRIAVQANAKVHPHIDRHFDLYVNEKNDPIMHLIRITDTSSFNTTLLCTGVLFMACQLRNMKIAVLAGRVSTVSTYLVSVRLM